MLRVRRSLGSVVFACLVAFGVLLVSAPVSADSAAQGASVTITAVITPVRIIVVNDQETIVEILSNGPSNVTPSVYKETPSGRPIVLTSDVYRQYATIMRQTDSQKTGVVYKLHRTDYRKNQRWASSLISILIARPLAAL